MAVLQAEKAISPQLKALDWLPFSGTRLRKRLEGLERRVSKLKTSADKAKDQRDKAKTRIKELLEERDNAPANAEKELQRLRKLFAYITEGSNPEYNPEPGVELPEKSSRPLSKAVLTFQQGPAPSSWPDQVRVSALSLQREGGLEVKIFYRGKDKDLLNWFDKHGIEVIDIQQPSATMSSLLDEITKIAKSSDRSSQIDNYQGCMMRYFIPHIAREQGWDDEFVLYADCDVVALRDLSGLPKIVSPTLFAAASEELGGSQGSFNAGIMLMNVRNLEEEFGNFMEFCRLSLPVLVNLAVDQTACRLFFRDRIAVLPSFYNWKSYWDPHEETAILHFHQFPPRDNSSAEGKRPFPLAAHKPQNQNWKNASDRWRHYRDTHVYGPSS
ncbi:MAG: glycosyltransferase [Verrucomicrobiota bacterium]